MKPLEPLRADHRFLQKMLGVILPGKVESPPEELTRISRVFRHMGGSWVGVFQGSADDLDLIKHLLKTAYKAGLLTKKGKW